ncbi:MAG: glycosyltransferase family 39 protein [Candidatus Uhrbacteria bacterium]|nr:glycosyltransferase family 39 protein [Candidatus Uhrbacteria bacterium]
MLLFLSKNDFFNILKIENHQVLLGVAAISGIIIFSKNKKQTHELINQAEQKEYEAEQSRRRLVDESKKNILIKIKNALYIEGWKYCLVLFFLIALATGIKYPYFGTSFTGKHSMKYAVYVDTTKYMYEQNNPFLNIRKYLADPVERPDGKWDTLGRPPIIEWGLLYTYKMLPFKTIEYNTRVFMHVLEVIAIISAYLFFKKILNKTQALFIIFFLVINPIFNFIYFLTVEDSMLIIFTFLCLRFFYDYLEENQMRDLFIAGIFLGLGLSNKSSIFLWLFPMLLTLFLLKNRDINSFIKSFGILAITSLLPTMVFRTSIRYLPKNALLFLGIFIIWIIAIWHYKNLLIKQEKNLTNLIEKLLKQKLLIYGSIGSFCIASLVFLYTTKLYQLSGEFLTDSSLIFNKKLYAYMLDQEFRIYITDNIYYLGIISLIFIFIAGNKKQLKSISIILGAIFYWVIASKVIFFHDYYTTIITISFCLTCGIFIYLLSKSTKNKIGSTLFVILVLLWVTPPAIKANRERLSKEREQISFKAAVDYLREHTNPDDLYIDNIDLSPLTIATSRSRIEPDTLIKDSIKLSIKNIGFSETMKKLNIAYLITFKEDPPLESFANIFTEEDLQAVSYRRADIIKSRLDPDFKYFSDSEKRKMIINDKNLKDKFVLEQTIGEYRFYTFKD